MSDKYLEKELNTISDIAEVNGFGKILINKLIYEFRLHENIKKVIYKEIIYKKCNYFPDLVRKVKIGSTETQYKFNSLSTKKIKDLICMKIDPTPKVELADVYAIPFKTDRNKIMEYTGMTKRKLKERIKQI